MGFSLRRYSSSPNATELEEIRTRLFFFLLFLSANSVFTVLELILLEEKTLFLVQSLGLGSWALIGSKQHHIDITTFIARNTEEVELITYVEAHKD